MPVPRYLPIDGELVSSQWHVLLLACRADGVAFHVNEGHRTFARQWELYRLYRSGRGALAAYPSPNAPHIRTGRLDHAIDFNNAAGVIRWLRGHGVPSAYLAVRGESWHVEAKASELVAAARRYGGDRVLKRGMRGKDVERLKRLLRGVGRFPQHIDPHFGLTLKRAVMGYQQSQHLRPDGIYGAKTRKHLEHDYYAKHPKK